MTGKLIGRKIAFVVANEGVEQAELTEPWKAVEAEGATPVLVALEDGKVQGFNHVDKADTFAVDQTVGGADVEDFHGLVLPGGVVNADQVRADEKAVGLVRAFFDSGRPVAVICHGGWAIVEADRVRGRTLTSWPSLQTDIRNAGGKWVDEEVQVCTAGPNVLVSSRQPDDLPAFNAEMIRALTAGRS